MRSLFIISSILISTAIFGQETVKKFNIECESKVKTVMQTDFFYIQMLEHNKVYEGYLLGAKEQNLNFEAFSYQHDSANTVFSHYWGRPRAVQLDTKQIHYVSHNNNGNLLLSKGNFALSLTGLLASTFLLLDPMDFFYNPNGTYNLKKKTQVSGACLAVSGASFAVGFKLSNPKKYYLNNPKKGKSTWKLTE